MGIPTEMMAGNQIFRIRRQLAAYIQDGGYQLIHCHGSRANMIGAMLRKPTGLPVVSTIHSDYRIDYMGRPLSRLTFGTINALAGSGAAPWFMAGDKNYAKSLQVDYLNGQETPTIRRMEVPGQLGFVWDIFLDWGITGTDFRGIARNNGVAIN